MAKEKVNVGLIGFGTIGTGVVRLFKDSAALINRKAGIKVELKKICDIDVERDRGVEIDKALLTNDADEVLNDPEIDIVIELIGGYKHALDFVMRAMENKKSIVTANKAMISRYWESLEKSASKNDVDIMAEASVAGGIPILRSTDKGLAANKIDRIMAILNGTANYILTRMSKAQISFDEALKEAQQKGFAEADPTLDIEGFDSMHKIVILSTIAFHRRVREEEVYVEGIRDVEYMDIQFARQFGYVMKLLAIAEKNDGELNVRVHPTFLGNRHLLTSVDYEYNAVAVRGDAVGDTLFYGKGAGEMPTASAVMSDVIFLARNIVSGKEKNPYSSKKNEELRIKEIGDIESKYYMRFTVADKAGVLSEISGALGKYNISIESMIQKGRNAKESVPVVIMCYESREEDVKKALEEIDKLDITRKKTVVYRVID